MKIVIAVNLSTFIAFAHRAFNAVKGCGCNVDFFDSALMAADKVPFADTRSSVKHKRNGNKLMNLFKDIKAKMRLLLIVSVGVAYRYCERVNLCFLGKAFCLFG